MMSVCSKEHMWQERGMSEVPGAALNSLTISSNEADN